MRFWLASLAVLAACSEAPSREDASDRPTVVSLNPCADAILAEVTAPGQLLAISHYSQDPASTSMSLGKAMRYPSTGGTAEEVLALAPDMVVADDFLAPATRRALDQAGIEVVSTGIARDEAEAVVQVAALSVVTGNSDTPSTLASDIMAAWATQRWDGEPVTVLLLQEGDIVPGEETLAHTMLEHTGFRSLSVARGMGQGAYVPLEQVLADPPDVVITAGGGRMLDHPLLREGSGVQHFELEPNLLFCGGPTIPRALERLMEIRRSVRQ